ncbi:polysaccharide biosynthesis protein [Paenibacillus chitinolyticus]|uniref:Polysaccharide biosynthesis protein n=1 Tax=Paenibacillus chitinolyticus TaxID=79263 RepID=A0A410X242_9BACL|nr:nucleoside-diphosphate sugar epimerase/dehydratase [Paenibacillus chitinolyticus]MCY9593508.1 polysaccharide biosynthesis protein [Paenibacillus chitinolyticus]MCY9597479.1 polysaccharide biosynthesis protein [Paenibacillus chitinolyticus]QAV20680.1 polysaccharide biosynthesis protein [Paenibacillus chitinolyticus]
MSYSKRTPMLVLIDMIIVWASIYLTFLAHFRGGIPQEVMSVIMLYTLVSGISLACAMFYFQLYNRIWQYASVGEMVAIAKAVIVSCLISYAVTSFLSAGEITLYMFLQNLNGILLMLGGSRFVWRVFCDNFYGSSRSRGGKPAQRTLVVGAGSCGVMFVKELAHNDSFMMKPVAFVDDDPYKQKLQLHGIPVMGNRLDIPRIVEEQRIDDIIIALPSVSKTQISDIINICKTTKARLKIIPLIQEYIQGKMAANQMRDVQVEDLLGRDPIQTDLQNIADYVQNKIVLVTGAGGSIGSELCRQVAPFKPARLLLLGHGENSIYGIEMEMRRLFPNLPIETVIADVQDRTRIADVFREFGPQVVFHAAAHKHVPLMERNPSEAIKNNVFGSKNVAECADEFGAERFVLISTDKAVNPTSIMGTTKRIAEMFIQSLDKHSKTKFVAVRFGNVLGSRGSVIPRFKDQIARGGPVTVTHPEMVRYFMTIPEAVQLVIQAGAFAKGGEVFILDMGKPVKIVDLATDLIRLSGYEPNVDIDIEFSGIRAGEKLYEELLTSEEGMSSTIHDRIFIGKPMNINRTELEFEMRRLERVLGSDPEEIRALLQHLVPTYRNVS